MGANKTTQWHVGLGVRLVWGHYESQARMAITGLTASLVGSIFLVTCASIAKVLLVAAGGFYLSHRGVLVPEIKKGISAVASKLCIPCLLFGRLVKTMSWELLHVAWVVLPFAILYVSMGIAMGFVLTRALGTPKAHVSTMIAAIAFANSQGLPIMMVEVIVAYAAQPYPCIPALILSLTLTVTLTLI